MLSQRIAILPEVLLLIINVTFFLFVPAKVYGTQWLAKSLVFNYTPRERSPVALVLSCLDQLVPVSCINIRIGSSDVRRFLDFASSIISSVKLGVV